MSLCMAEKKSAAHANRRCIFDLVLWIKAEAVSVSPGPIALYGAPSVTDTTLKRASAGG